MSDTHVEPDEQTVFVADGVDEFVERTRLQQILEARERAAEALRDAELRHMNARSNGLGETQAARAAGEPARAAVESYVLECEQIYRGTEGGQKLWTDAPLAVVDIRDGISLGNRENIKKIKLNGRLVKNPQQGIQLCGVQQFVGLSPAVEVTYERELNRRGAPTEPVTEQVGWATPVWVSREAFRATNALLTSTELGVQFGTGGDNTVDSEYSELLQNMDNETKDE